MICSETVETEWSTRFAVFPQIVGAKNNKYVKVCLGRYQQRRSGPHIEYRPYHHIPGIEPFFVHIYY